MTPHGGRAVVTGRKADESLYDFDLAAYDSGDTFDRSEAQGFIEIFGLSSKVAARRDLAQPPLVRQPSPRPSAAGRRAHIPTF
ncbi:hypothetical protein GCM10010446_36560 [Streptomyces enissocaesilis]|uniref:Arginosuccinate synthase C-terminal domain-containing protein n=1 Tax=Streptomyces enissocaesilis TaxID=332589 RepID=A0ABP6JWT7_9ACTN